MQRCLTVDEREKVRSIGPRREERLFKDGGQGNHTVCHHVSAVVDNIPKWIHQSKPLGSALILCRHPAAAPPRYSHQRLVRHDVVVALGSWLRDKGSQARRLGCSIIVIINFTFWRI